MIMFQSIAVKSDSLEETKAACAQLKANTLVSVVDNNWGVVHGDNSLVVDDWDVCGNDFVEDCGVNWGDVVHGDNLVVSGDNNSLVVDGDNLVDNSLVVDNWGAVHNLVDSWGSVGNDFRLVVRHGYLMHGFVMVGVSFVESFGHMVALDGMRVFGGTFTVLVLVMGNRLVMMVTIWLIVGLNNGGRGNASLV